MTLGKNDMRDLLTLEGPLTPKEIVGRFPKEYFQEVANALWMMIDCGEIDVTRDEKIKLSEKK